MYIITHRSLKARVQSTEEWMFGRQRQYSLLSHGTFNVVILQYAVLLQYFHCKNIASCLVFSQQYLASTTVPVICNLIY